MNAIGRALGGALIALSAIPQVAQASPPDIGMAKLLWHIRHETDAGNSNAFDIIADVRTKPSNSSFATPIRAPAVTMSAMSFVAMGISRPSR